MTGINRRHWPGDPDRPALALHCMLGSASYWGPIADLLGGRIDLQAFDMPSHGRSDPWQRQPDGPDLHTAVTRIAASFIQRPVDLIGHSMGAGVALRIAVAAPEAIRTLTLIEPTIFTPAPDAEQHGRDTEFARLLTEGDLEGATRAFIATWGGESFDDMPPKRQAQMVERIPLIAELEGPQWHDSAGILRDGGLEAIDAPVMLISGANSPRVIHSIAEALAERLPDVGRATVPGAGHMLPLTHPEAVAGLIAANLDRA